MFRMIKKMSILTLFILGSIANAQDLSPKSTKITYKGETIDGWRVVLVPETSLIKKAFKSFVKDRYDIRMKGFGLLSNKDVLTGEDVTLTKVSSKRMNLYMSAVEDSGESEFMIFGSHGYIYFSKDKNESELTALREIMVDFLKSYLPKYYKERLRDSTEKYEDLVDIDEKLNENIADNKKKIEDLLLENENLTEKIASNKEKIGVGKEELIKRQEQLESVNKRLNEIK